MVRRNAPEAPPASRGLQARRRGSRRLSPAVREWTRRSSRVPRSPCSRSRPTLRRRDRPARCRTHGVRAAFWWDLRWTRPRLGVDACAALAVPFDPAPAPTEAPHTRAMPPTCCDRVRAGWAHARDEARRSNARRREDPADCGSPRGSCGHGYRRARGNGRLAGRDEAGCYADVHGGTTRPGDHLRAHRHGGGKPCGLMTAARRSGRDIRTQRGCN